VHEVIYSLLMMQNDFVAATANVEEIEPAAAQANIVREKQDVRFDTILSNSFGFGGTNASLVLKRFSD